MRKNKGSIPVNKFGDEIDTGITVDRIAFEGLPEIGEWEQPERHDRHSFFLLEEGSVTMDIDFQRHEIQSPAIIYMHPDQVHSIITFQRVVVTAWAIDNENLNPDYIQLLEDITPATPMALNKETLSLLADATSLCIKISERQKGQLYHALFRDHCNALVALVISLYLDGSTPADKLSRAEVITKAFREALTTHFINIKRPAGYAEKLNLSTPYLNECVKNVTGYPVSYHIQQRIILEAKRLLYHSNQSLKEVAATLGYDDYPYFSRLFAKIAGVPPLSFRNKNID